MRGWIPISRDSIRSERFVPPETPAPLRVELVAPHSPEGNSVRLQPITYRGRVVACVTRDRCLLSRDLHNRDVGDPERTFVLFMCRYAADVLRGELAGPYNDTDARRYARAALIPDEFADPERASHVRRRLTSTARALGVPADELESAVASRNPRGDTAGR